MIREEVKTALDQKSATSPSRPSTSRSDPGVPQLPVSSDSEEEEGAISSSGSSEDEAGRALFLPDETSHLLKAIRATMGIEESREQRSIQDRMFSGLDERKKKVFPVHQSIKKLITKEWSNPERKLFLSKSFKRKYPFEEEDAGSWDKVPKVDAPVARLSKKTSLPFEDMGLLKDPMDRKAEVLLKKSWETATAALRPSIAATCTARSLGVWMEQLEERLSSGTSREDILASIPVLRRSVDFLADSSADMVRLSAKSAALANAARRSIWLRSWSGDASSKNRLCGIPCEGDRLFGSGLDDILEAADSKKGFPADSKRPQRRPFRGRRRDRQDQEKRVASSRWQPNRQKSKGYLFSSSSRRGAKTQ